MEKIKLKTHVIVCSFSIDQSSIAVLRILLCRAIEHIDTSEKLFVDLSFCNLPLVIRRKQYTYSDEIKDFMHGIRFNIVVVVIRVYFVLYQVHKFILFIHIILLL